MEYHKQLYVIGNIVYTPKSFTALYKKYPESTNFSITKSYQSTCVTYKTITVNQYTNLFFSFTIFFDYI